MVTKMTKPILDEDEYALLLPEEDFHSEMLSNDGSKTNSQVASQKTTSSE